MLTNVMTTVRPAGTTEIGKNIEMSGHRLTSDCHWLVLVKVNAINDVNYNKKKTAIIIINLKCEIRF